MSKFIDNTHLFGQSKDDDNPKQEQETQQKQAQETQQEQNNLPDDALFAVSLLRLKDGNVRVHVEGTPSLVDLQMLIQQALNGVSTRITSETTVSMLLQVLDRGPVDRMNIDPTQAN
jgi:hypothetical protein